MSTRYSNSCYTRSLIPEPSRGDIRTVVIPLLEDHTRHCPRQYLSLIADDRSFQALGNKAAFSAYAEAIGFAHLCPKTYASSADAVFLAFSSEWTSMPVEGSQSCVRL